MSCSWSLHKKYLISCSWSYQIAETLQSTIFLCKLLHSILRFPNPPLIKAAPYIMQIKVVPWIRRIKAAQQSSLWLGHLINGKIVGLDQTSGILWQLFADINRCCPSFYGYFQCTFQINGFAGFTLNLLERQVGSHQHQVAWFLINFIHRR